MFHAVRRLTATAAALVLGAAAVLAASPAAAVPVRLPTGNGCVLSVNPSSATWSISNYNPFSSAPISATYSVTYANSGTANCDFVVSFDTDGQPYGLIGAGQSLPYVLLDTSDNGNATPFSGTTPANSRVRLVLQPGGQQLVNYSFVVDLTQLPTDGDFDQTLFVEALSGVDVIAQKQVQLTLDVAPSAVISLRGAYLPGPHGGALVDLGDLRSGPATTLLQLYVQSTGGYRIDAESANAGKLALADASQWSIPYTVQIGPNAMNLASPAHFDAPRQSTARQDTLPLGFVIGDTSNKRAGVYTDVITVSVTAQ